MTEERIIALAGNPNVGKSTVFNSLTGLRQHTGNWAGKTVGNATGKYVYKNTTYTLVDIPGTYSLMPSSPEEEIARDFILSGDHELVVIVADATSLERNLYFVMQVLQVTSDVVLCVNLMDEANKKNILIDLDELSNKLNIPVVGAQARDGYGMEELKEQIWLSTSFTCKRIERRVETLRIADASFFYDTKKIDDYKQDQIVTQLLNTSKEIYSDSVRILPSQSRDFDRKVDSIVTSKKYGIPIMLLLFGAIFWITIVGANYPSQLLSGFFSELGIKLAAGFEAIHMPALITDPLINGVYLTLTWVIAVMLPPMAIFFPLFTLLEDSGYLPRLAFNLDFLFRRAQAHGKQALTTCMGFGCNACAVTGCRIIDSPREKMIAMITNTFVPCNGRFPILITLISAFFVGSSLLSAGILTLVILIGFSVTLLVSFFLSKTLLKGLPSSITLELPPYRRPKIGSVIIRSILDRTLFVLGRAILVAAPAGLLIWLLVNIKVGSEPTPLLNYCIEFLNPLGHLMGMDGVILMAFILAFPANEIVLPIIIMTYTATGMLVEPGSSLQLFQLFSDNGWTSLTAVCTILFCIMHFPCGTTCLTIRKESGSWKWTALGFALPTLVGIVVCTLVATLARIFFI